jgi:hypothetical protein
VEKTIQWWSGYVICSAATYALAALSATRLRATLRLSLHEGSPFKFIDRSFGYAKTQTVIGLRRLWMKVWI